ncbi:hypothetical protein OPW19_06385 [Vibrio europaeus]|uniref:hypothetical protein n=1 Tax=Vibrio europaeus TaxID=300876 RepID=UPI00233EFB51|nr:hypothetical protein [Vibrio europaeus]MDC5819454.1 hypothetical protein [Vibrio europaeus]MDC5871994.1 hypothetical protein [Vibrio europaeus]
MLMLYNPPPKAKPDIEIATESQGSTGTAGIFHFTDHVELVDLSFKRSSLSANRGVDSQLCSLTLSFLKENQLIERRYLYLYFAPGIDHHYPMTLIKPKGADEMQLISSVMLTTRIETRLIFKQEVPDAVGIPPLINR